jgi:NADPH:quinone reductase-like Zn-dependent oxidoreductase
MKAVLFRKHGGPEVLEFSNIPTPEPKPNEVLIRLHAAALNRMDIMVRNGWPGLKLALPHINGADGAGEIIALGPGVARQGKFKVCDRVVINANLGCGSCSSCLAGQDNMCKDWHLLGETVRGTYAEYISIPVRQVVKLSKGFDYHVAAAAGLVYLTAWHSLIVRGKLQAGEIVLIVGAGGGVNTACLDLAKHFGAQVIVISSNSAKQEQASAHGADIVIDRSNEPEWSKSVYLATKKHGVDIVVDNVGTTFAQSLRTLRKGGRLLTVGNSGGAKFEIDNRFIFAKHLTIIGSTMGTRKDFSAVMDQVFKGKLHPIIDSTFSLADAPKAQERLWAGESFGKIVLDMDQVP